MAQNRCIMTVCSPDHFQYYIPTWSVSARLLWPGVCQYVVVRGEADAPILGVYSHSSKRRGAFFYEDYPFLESTSNCLRFVHPMLEGADQVLVTDVDLVFTNKDLWGYLERQMKAMESCYGAHHGPYQYPKRPEVAPDGWTGNMQRIAGGFVLLTPEWYGRTEDIRAKWDMRLARGDWGGFREADEVMLYRICKESGLEIPSDTRFDAGYRGLHLGDFKSTMKHRYNNMARMRGMLKLETVHRLVHLFENNEFRDALEVARINKAVRGVWDNVAYHIQKRVGAKE